MAVPISASTFLPFIWIYLDHQFSKLVLQSWTLKSTQIYLTTVYNIKWNKHNLGAGSTGTALSNALESPRYGRFLDLQSAEPTNRRSPLENSPIQLTECWDNDCIPRA
ncbi:hypothetical protein AAC387_Pa02g0561 [Persea americana]